MQIMTVPEVGAICLGIVVGYFVKWFLKRISNYTLQGLGFILSLVFGGAAVNFLKNDVTVFWYYPIGLLAGIIIYITLALCLGGDPNIIAYHKENTGKNNN